jgi:hypothetical protein
MVVAFSKDPKEGVDLHYLFRSYDHTDGYSQSKQRFQPKNPGPAHHGPLWEVACATSAAPRYFEAVTFMNRHFLDGGLGANNPGKIAFQEVYHMHAYSPALFISVGTGVKKDLPKMKKRDQARELLTIDRRVPRKQGLKKWLELSRFLKDFTTDTEDIANDVKFHAERCDTPHRRFTVPDHLGNIPLDDWRPAQTGELTLDEIRTYTREYLDNEETQEHLEFCANELVTRRRLRALTERWEKFATDIEYHCPAEKCRDTPASRYKERDRLRQHYIHSHPEVLTGHPGDLEAFVDAGRVLKGPRPEHIVAAVKKLNRTTGTGLSNGVLRAPTEPMTNGI